MPLLEDATPGAALADLDTALSISPALVTARQDRCVIRFSAWFDDAWLSLMFDGPPNASNENLAAAVSDLEFAAQQSPDWQLARFNYGIARLFQGITLFGVYIANGADKETVDAIQNALEDAIVDATWLIDQDPTAGWAYFMRLVATDQTFILHMVDSLRSFDMLVITKTYSGSRYSRQIGNRSFQIR